MHAIHDTNSGNEQGKYESDDELQHKLQKYKVTLQQASIDMQCAIVPSLSELSLLQRIIRAEQIVSTAENWAALNEWESVSTVLHHTLSIEDDFELFFKTADMSDHLRERAFISVWDSLLLRFRAALNLNQELPGKQILSKLKELPKLQYISKDMKNVCLIDILEFAVAQAPDLLQSKKVEWALPLLQAAQEAFGALGTASSKLSEVGINDEVNRLGHQNLLLLSIAFLENDNANQGENALSCIRALEDSLEDSSEITYWAAMHSVKHRVLASLGKTKEASGELSKLIHHKESRVDMISEAIIFDFLYNQSCEGIDEILTELQSAFQNNPEKKSEVLWKTIQGLVPRILSSIEPNSKFNVAISKVVQLLEYQCQRIDSKENLSSILQQHVWALTWNFGCYLLENDNPDYVQYALSCFKATKKLYPEDSYLSEGKNISTRDIYMAQGLCLVSLNRNQEALEVIEKAENFLSNQLDSCFLRLKASLQAANWEASLIAMKALTLANGVNANVLRLVCCEAMDCGAVAAAEYALEEILRKLDEEPNFLEKLPTGYESIVIQNLISIIISYSNETNSKAIPCEQPESKDFVTVDNDREKNETHENDDSSSQRNKKLITWYEILLRRIKTAGAAKVFGLDTTQNDTSFSSRIEWLAGVAWNVGVDSVKKPNLASTKLLVTAGILYGLHPNPNFEILERRMICFIATAGEILDSYSKELSLPETDQLSMVSEALQHLEEARVIANNMRKMPTTKINFSLEIYRLILQFKADLLSGNFTAAETIIQEARRLDFFHAEHFITMAACCRLKGTNEWNIHQTCNTSCSTITSKQCAKIALKAAMDDLTSKPDVKYEMVTKTLRALFDLADTDTERLSLISEAASILEAFTYDLPMTETQWIVSTAWNRGVLNAKFKRIDDAIPWMEMALKAADHIEGYQKGSQNRVE